MSLKSDHNPEVHAAEAVPGNSVSEMIAETVSGAAERAAIVKATAGTHEAEVFLERVLKSLPHGIRITSDVHRSFAAGFFRKRFVPN